MNSDAFKTDSCVQCQENGRRNYAKGRKGEKVQVDLWDLSPSSIGSNIR
jgi:hypothetical protein